MRKSIRRLRIFWLAGLLFGLGSGLSAAASCQIASFPVRATIDRAKTAVRSGPDRVHYATDELARGASVNVYRLDPQGWCAIEPPRRSFSIVPAGQIDQTDVHLGKINTDSAKAWVGTLLGAVSDPLWQVRLKKGENVDILGLIETPESGEQPAQAWFQIAPPAGEFRWIHIDHLTNESQSEIYAAAGLAPAPLARAEGQHNVRTPSIPTERIRQPIRSESPSRIRHDFAATPGADQNFANGFSSSSTVSMNQALPPSAEMVASGWRPASRPAGSFVQSPVTAGVQRDANSGTGIVNRTAALPQIASSERPAAKTVATSTVPPVGVSPLSLSQLELELSLAMTRDPSRWDFGKIRSRAAAWRDRETDWNTRQELDSFLAKLERRQLLNSTASATAPTAHGVIPTAPRNLVASSIGPADGTLAGKYDAQGTLEELVRDGGLGATTYVLRDPSGRITHHVQPSPGLNLHRFLHQRIGIQGQRGYNRSLNLDHVTASRIINLETVR